MIEQITGIVSTAGQISSIELVLIRAGAKKDLSNEQILLVYSFHFQHLISCEVIRAMHVIFLMTKLIHRAHDQTDTIARSVSAYAAGSVDRLARGDLLNLRNEFGYSDQSDHPFSARFGVHLTNYFRFRNSSTTQIIRAVASRPDSQPDSTRRPRHPEQCRCRLHRSTSRHLRHSTTCPAYSRQ